MESENYILIHQLNENQVSSLVADLAAKYSHTGFVDEINILKRFNTEDEFLLLFPNHPDFQTFVIFINYLNHSSRIQLKPKVIGYWNRASDSALPGGQIAMLYGTSPQVVEAVTGSGKSYEINTHGNIRPIDTAQQEYIRHPYQENEYDYFMDVYAPKEAEKMEKKQGCFGMAVFMIAGFGGFVILVLVTIVSMAWGI